MKGKTKEGGKRKFFICFRPRCTLDGKPAGSKTCCEFGTREKRPVKENNSVTTDRKRSGVNGGDGGEEMAKPWGKGEPVFAFISLDPNGNKYVIQTPAQVLNTVDNRPSRRKKARQAFAKVFNAMTFRDSATKSFKGAGAEAPERSPSLSTRDSHRTAPLETRGKLAVADTRKVESRTPSFTLSSLSTSSSYRSRSTASSESGGSRRMCAIKSRRMCTSPTGLGLYLLLMSILSIMMLWGRPCAILWTSTWLYVMTHLRRDYLPALTQWPAGAELKENKRN